MSLTDTERQFLTFALDLAADRMASRGDEFTSEDEAALEKLRSMADAATAPPVDRTTVLQDAADAVAALSNETFVNVAVYPMYDDRQKSALGAAERRLRRMATEAP
ncbi:hypothetical protein [Streptomyces sp. NPDC004376]